MLEKIVLSLCPRRHQHLHFLAPVSAYFVLLQVTLLLLLLLLSEGHTCLVALVADIFAAVVVS